MFSNKAVIGSNNVVMGNGAGGNFSSALNDAVIIGSNASTSAGNASYSVIIGSSAEGYSGAGGGNYNTLLGYNVNVYGYATNNVLIGDSIFSTNNGPSTGGYNTIMGSGAASGGNFSRTGTGNVMMGYQVGNGIFSANNNVILGTSAGATLATGNNNILLGNAVDVTASGSSYRLNLGNLVYGTMTGSKQVGIGSSTLTAGAGLDLSSLSATGNSSILLPTGSTTNRPTGTAGMLRYNSTTDQLEGYFNATATWSTLLTTTSTMLSALGGNLGTSTATTSPHVSGDLTTGLFSGTASTVSVATAGVEALPRHGNP